METATYDCFAITDNAYSSDEDSVPSTPRMTTAEQIEGLYDRLQRMREELEKFHWEHGIDEGEELSSDGWTGLAKAPSHKPHWDDSDDSRLEECPVGYEVRVSDLQPKRSGRGKAYMIPPSTCWMGRMPPEILMLVFELVSNADAGMPDDAAEFGGRNGWRTPITLAHVCCSWRTLVLETPSLWRSFSLVLDRAPRSMEGLKASLKLWLQSSRTIDVAINLEMDPACANRLDRELMDQLEGMVRRCWRLRLNVSHETICRILKLPLSRLRTLEVRSSWLIKDIEGLSVQAPGLRALTILGPTMVKFAKNTLPWSQLREYRGTCWADVQQHLDIVRLTPNLELCALCPFYETKGNATPIRLTQLRSLHVSSYLGTSMGGFLRCLEVPALEELRLEVPEESPGFGCSVWPESSVLDLLERSKVKLERLELVGMDNS